MSLQGLDGTEASTVVTFHGTSGSQPIVSPKYCPGVNNKPGYLCETGHCCGETGCCTYYYELWWFWLLSTMVILFSCFCAYRHRWAKLRVQQQQRQREINLIAYNGACNYPTSMLDLSFMASFKLPSYEEVAAQPCTPPPPYSSVFALRGGGGGGLGGGALGGPSSSYTPDPHHYHHPHPPCPPYPYPGPYPTSQGPYPPSQSPYPSAHGRPLARSAMTSSQSSDNYTSCSCESCSITSPSSTSFSMQVTDETYDSSRGSSPGDGGSAPLPPGLIPAVAPDAGLPRGGLAPSVAAVATSGMGSSFPVLSLNPPRPPHPPHFPLSPLILSPTLAPSSPSSPSAPLSSSSPPVRPLFLSEPLGTLAVHRRDQMGVHSPPGPPPCPTAQPFPKHALFSSGVAFFERKRHDTERKQETALQRRKDEEKPQGSGATEEEDDLDDDGDDDDDDGDDDDEDHFRHRRLTGDSGIEVCRCHIKRKHGDRDDDRVMEKGGGGNRGKQGGVGGRGAVGNGEGAEPLHDSVDCSLQAHAAVAGLGMGQPRHPEVTSPPGLPPKVGKAIATVETS
ncbi:hypothetical protein NHX12_017769 [Muraenolepis orangiensis]|uniref:WW domain binding protein 1 n=1 Tax=Muraenolepis orangiensis TaxID=630683 RepID=A0A9Q0EVT0_9TELE|nr:hypothetical protein NHX12_017769 [Muraenolepis orangiensis]